VSGEPRPVGELLAGLPLVPPEGVGRVDLRVVAEAEGAVGLPVLDEGKRARAAKAGLRRRFEVGQSADLDGKTNEQLADILVRQAAYMILFGDEAFTPKDLKEASAQASTWAAIAKSETLRKGRAKDDVVEDDPTRDVAKALVALRDTLKKRTG
jgi:hypothetical protein